LWDAWLLVMRFLDGSDLLRLEHVSRRLRSTVRDAEPVWCGLFWNEHGGSPGGRPKLPACFAHAFDHVRSWRWLWQAYTRHLPSGFLDGKMSGPCSIFFKRETETLVYVGDVHEGVLHGYGTMFVCAPLQPQDAHDRCARHPLVGARTKGWSEALWMGDSRYAVLDAFMAPDCTATPNHCTDQKGKAKRDRLWERLVVCPMDALGRWRTCEPSLDPRAASLMMLPDEVLVPILERVSAKDLSLARASCQRLRCLVDGYDSIWFEAFMRDIAPQFAPWIARMSASMPAGPANNPRAIVRQCFSHAHHYLEEGRVWQWLYRTHLFEADQPNGACAGGVPLSVTVASLRVHFSVQGCRFINTSPYLCHHAFLTYNGAMASWAVEGDIWVPRGYGLITIRSPYSYDALAHLQVWCTCSDTYDPEFGFQMQVLTYTWANGCRYVMDLDHPGHGVTMIPSACDDNAKTDGRVMSVRGPHKNGIPVRGSIVCMDGAPYIRVTDKNIYFWGGPDDPCNIIICIHPSEPTQGECLVVVGRRGDAVAVMASADRDENHRALFYYPESSGGTEPAPRLVTGGDPGPLADLVARLAALEDVPDAIKIMCDRHATGEPSTMDEDEAKMWANTRIVPMLDAVSLQAQRMAQVCDRMPSDIVHGFFGQRVFYA